MTLSAGESVRCPKCGRTEPVVVHRSVNATLNPELKAGVRDLSLNWHRCGECGTGTPTADHVLYHDMRRSLMVSSSTAGPMAPPVPGQMRHYTLRVVDGPVPLAEKVAVFENDLDDMAVEIVKFRVRYTLLMNFENLLWVADAVPLAPDRLVFLECTDKFLEVKVAGVAELAFLLLLDCLPGMCPYLVLVPGTEYRRAAEAAGPIAEQTGSGQWLRVGEHLAALVHRGECEPIPLRALLIPQLMEAFPSAKPLWERHVTNTPPARFQARRRPWVWRRFRKLRQAHLELFCPPQPPG